jgi:ribosomal protein L17
MKFRTLGRNSSHRQALLRNLVTSLVKQESIQTTWPKAKEAQRMADKLITLAKRNNETSRREAQSILYVRRPYLRPSSGHPAPAWAGGRAIGRDKGESSYFVLNTKLIAAPMNRRQTHYYPSSSASFESATSTGRAATRESCAPSQRTSTTRPRARSWSWWTGTETYASP